MSFIDKAKEKLKGIPVGMGEELVRRVDYDEPEEEQEKRPAVQKQSKPSAASKLLSMQKPKMPSLSKLIPASKSAEQKEPRVERPTPAPQQKSPAVSKDSAFEVTESAFVQPPKSSNVEDSFATTARKIEDILEVLDIPATFEIDRNVFLPEDMNVTFDYQVPQGYDVGQVRAFVNQCTSSVAYYVKLLKLRNEHVAKMATAFDRMQVDLNNQKLQSEIANGINIMPTSDDEDLLNQNMEYRLLVKRLEDQIKNLQQGEGLSDGERQTFDDLQDQLSVARRENEVLADENYDLKNRLAYMEELEPDEPKTNDSSEKYADDEYDEESFGWDVDNSEEGASSFPSLDATDSDSGELPEFPQFEELPEKQQTQGYSQTILPNTSFFVDEEEPLDEFLEAHSSDYDSEENNGESMIELMSDSGKLTSLPKMTYTDDDDEDELDAIMNAEWGNK